MTEVPKISGQSVPKEEKRRLHDEGQAFHDELELPGDHPPHFKLPVAITVDERSLNMEIQPLLAEHRKECGQQGTR